MARARHSPNCASVSSPAARKGTKGLKRACPAADATSHTRGRIRNTFKATAVAPAIWIPR